LATPPELFRFTANLRNEVRHPVEQAAVLRVPGMAGGIYLVTILDVSKSGLRVSCTRSLVDRTQVEVIYAKLKILGEVRYVREVELGTFHLGIQVVIGSEGVLLKHLKLPE
jgi:hypothetical protein